MKSGVGYLFILLALGVVLSYARPNMELPREKRGIYIGRDNHGDIYAPCTAVVCNKKKREAHVESEDTNEENQKTLESPLLDKSLDSDSSRQKRGISIGGNNRGDIHAPCTAVVCNKKKRETQMNTENVETSETNAQIPENPDFDQNSNLDTEKLKDPEVSTNLGVSDISREKRGIKIGGNNNGDIHAPCTAVVCNKKKRSVNIRNDNDGSIYARRNPVNIGRDNNGEIYSNPAIVNVGRRNNGRVRDPNANNHFHF